MVTSARVADAAEDDMFASGIEAGRYCWDEAEMLRRACARFAVVDIEPQRPGGTVPSDDDVADRGDGGRRGLQREVDAGVTAGPAATLRLAGEKMAVPPPDCSV
jgi:hypothetical protein